MRRRSGGTTAEGEERISPPTVMVPAVGAMKPAMVRSVVVLPHPDAPRSVTNSRSSMSMWIPLRARNAP